MVTAVISASANPAHTGILELASTDTACWRNNANGADLCISKTAGDAFQLNGDTFATLTATQTLTNKTLTSPTINTPTLDGFGAAHVATLNATANFGVALGTQTLVASVPSTGTVYVSIQAVQTLVSVGCTNVTNSVQPTLFFTAPGGTAESYGPAGIGISVGGNGTIDIGDAPTLLAPQPIIAKAGTAITYTTTSTLASTGCSTVPQYTVYAKAIL